MPSNEGHIHWTGLPGDAVTYLDQELWMTAEVSNMATAVTADPIGTIRIKASGFEGAGLALPSEGWEAIPGTMPVLEARADAAYPIGLIRIRQQ